ncbi:MAG TPA: hypothetical protein VMW29_02485 [Candidatus Bathyarchaeia archaeon]|nr:hypothetical protein [Candidatus Bathyarchaeia archaeon]
MQITAKGKLIILCLALLLTFGIVLCQTFDSSWRDIRKMTLKDHLQMDVVASFYKVGKILKNRSFTDFGYNEYQPGAIFYFLIPALGYLIKNSFEVYLFSTIGLNLFILTFLTFLYKKYCGFFNALVFLLIVLFSGPVLLFRFEPVVALFVVVAILFWQKKGYFKSMLFLGLGTSIKIFPLILLPYFLILLFKQKQYKKIFQATFIFVLTNLFILSCYLFLGGKPQEVLTSIKVHSLKPVGVESIPGTILTYANKLIRGKYPLGIGNYGIFGIRPGYNFLSDNFYNRLWILPVLIFYFFVLLKRIKKTFQPEIAFLIINLFVLFYKGSNPQYFFWYFPLFPLFRLEEEKKFNYIPELYLILLILLLTQLIYPYLYNILLDIFYVYGQAKETFYLLSLRNLLVVFLFVILFKKIFFVTSKNFKN